jgi:uncharacterized protein
VVPDLPPLVERTLQRLIRYYSPERIIVFGSYSKATVHSRSDVDLLVVANVDGSLDLHQRRARQLAAGCFPRVDVVLATPAEVSEANTARSPFLASILRTGTTVYSRSDELHPASGRHHAMPQGSQNACGGSTQCP